MAIDNFWKIIRHILEIGAILLIFSGVKNVVRLFVLIICSPFTPVKYGTHL